MSIPYVGGISPRVIFCGLASAIIISDKIKTLA